MTSNIETTDEKKIDYTHENWLLFLKAYFPDAKNKGERYALIAAELGMSPDSVANQCAPAKELPTWAKAFLFSFLKFPGVPAAVDTAEKNIIQKFESLISTLKS